MNQTFYIRDKSIGAFFALLRAGLWEEDCELCSYNDIDYNILYQLASEQTVLGLITAGIEHVIDVKVPSEVALNYVGQALLIEQKNESMNSFIVGLISKMKGSGITAVLVKGQGIARCYERPLWRTCGDVDLLLDESNYIKAKSLLLPLAQYYDVEDKRISHQAIIISSWEVELHGSLHANLWKNIDNMLDNVQRLMFKNNNVRNWVIDGEVVRLPDPNCDIIFMFSHILQHFYRSGIGLRQICDWCRLLWCYNDSIDIPLLEKRLNYMKAINEWKSFAYLAVHYLGCPPKVMPLYEDSKQFNKKSNRIVSIIIKSGNFGQNRDNHYKQGTSVFIRKVLTYLFDIRYTLNIICVFPINGMKVLKKMTIDGLRSNLTALSLSRFYRSTLVL